MVSALLMRHSLLRYRCSGTYFPCLFYVSKKINAKIKKKLILKIQDKNKK